MRQLLIVLIAFTMLSCNKTNEQLSTGFWIFESFDNKETGEPIAYSMEELEGDYVTVTKEQYHQGRYDVVIKDNGIFKLDSIQYIRKLIPDQKGVACDLTNVLILDPTSNKKWKVKTYIAE